MDEDLKLVERLRARVSNPTLMEEAAATITRLRDEIEALKSDVSDLVRAGSDEATENERLVKERDEALKSSAYWFERHCDDTAALDDMRTLTAQRNAALEALDNIHAIACVSTVGEPMTPTPVMDDVERIIRIAAPFATSRALEGE